jgi:hypothetical protein
MSDLNNLRPAGSGWDLDYAYGINDAGQIAGVGTHNGLGRAFLLTPQVTFAGLIGLVNEFDTNPSVAATMVATLSSAQAAANAHSVLMADALLSSFTGEVSQQSGKSLTAAQAAILMQYAAALAVLP